MNTAEILQHRADVLSKIRTFFAEHYILEVETPLLNPYTVTSPHIQSITANNFYLQTSPEYAMKRLLSEGSGSIYQICKAFRLEESGRWHAPEFTMLEWYRLEYDHHDLMGELSALLKTLGLSTMPEKYSYFECFQKYCDLDPFSLTPKAGFEYAQSQNISLEYSDEQDTDFWLNIIMSHCIEPQLGIEQPVFIYDYPESQKALAKIRREKNKPAVAERFELYINRVEIANGFHELTCPKEQRARFLEDNQVRKSLNLPEIELDTPFLKALEHGLPECSGVAVGLDRLMAVLINAKSLEEITPLKED